MNSRLDINSSWQYLFNPHSVAVIGASNTPGSWGFGILRHLLDSAKRSVYPVNPSVSEILGKTTYDRVVNIPDSVDLAVIAVRASQVPTVLQECVLKGIKAAVVISAGFAETGESGRQLEAELVNIARQGGICFIGPNSMGHADTVSRLSTLAWAEEITSGAVSVISQSGFYGEQIMRSGKASGIGFSKFISTGNEADLHFEDYLEYLAQDENTRVIATYIEGLREGRRFFKLAKKTTRTKPLITIKAGGTKESARAAQSHTGTIVGSDAVYEAAFRQTGVMKVNDDEELCDVATALLYQPLPGNNRVGILTMGGGPGVVAAEACEREGLVISPLSSSTMEKLNACLPPRWSHSNPVDVSGLDVPQLEAMFLSLWTIMADENIDAILLQMPVVLSPERVSAILGLNARETMAVMEMQNERLKSIQRKANEFGKPVYLLTSTETSLSLRRKGIPAYPNPQRAARVLRHLVTYRHYLNMVDN